ncbi:MAG: Hsp20/alpha crystallin family protein [Streptosporangiaceae bacterium]
MLLTSFDPFVQDFDKVVQRTLGWAENTAPRSVLPMDVIRHDEDIVLRIDLPGADPASIEVTADRGVLTVAARRSEEYGESDRLVLRERVLGSFSRKIRLAETVDTEKIEATYDNGVLSILLPLQEKARPRKIEIKHSGAPEISA